VQKPKEEWGMEERRRNGSGKKIVRSECKTMRRKELQIGIEVKTCIPGWAMEIER
jgi:hypothetical protein